jgi:hypothetical protein
MNEMLKRGEMSTFGKMRAANCWAEDSDEGTNILMLQSSLCCKDRGICGKEIRKEKWERRSGTGVRKRRTNAEKTKEEEEKNDLLISKK